MGYDFISSRLLTFYLLFVPVIQWCCLTDKGYRGVTVLCFFRNLISDLSKELSVICLFPVLIY